MKVSFIFAAPPSYWNATRELTPEFCGRREADGGGDVEWKGSQGRPFNLGSKRGKTLRQQKKWTCLPMIPNSNKKAAVKKRHDIIQNPRHS